MTGRCTVLLQINKQRHMSPPWHIPSHLAVGLTASTTKANNTVEIYMLFGTHRVVVIYLKSRHGWSLRVGAMRILEQALLDIWHAVLQNDYRGEGLQLEIFHYYLWFTVLNSISLPFTETEMASIWRFFCHWLHCKLILPVQWMMKISQFSLQKIMAIYEGCIVRYLLYLLSGKEKLPECSSESSGC